MILKANTSNNIEIDFNTNLTRLLVCPISGGNLYYDEKENCLISKVAKIKFPVKKKRRKKKGKTMKKPVFSD